MTGKELRVGSVFTGIGGFDLGLERAGMRCVFQVENDKHCLEVIEERWPSSGCRMSATLGDTTCRCAKCLSAASLVRISPSPGSVRVYQESDPDFSSSLFDLHPSWVPLGWLSKTYPAYYRRALADDVSNVEQFYRNIAEPTSTWSAPPSKTQGIASRGECWTRDGSESPSDAVVCSLSDMLDRNVPERFYLSPRAARGILRRCEKRGRTLPIPLRLALTRLATMEDSAPSPESISSSTPNPAETCGSESATNRAQSRARKHPPSPTPSTPTAGHTGESTESQKPLLVRRLTAIECERLQGFPEGWTDVGTDNSETPLPCPLSNGSGGG